MLLVVIFRSQKGSASKNVKETLICGNLYKISVPSVIYKCLIIRLKKRNMPN